MKKILMAYMVFALSACSSTESIAKLVTINDEKMGIATKTPDELLTVNGSIHAKEVRVDLDGALAPDYVFAHYNKQPTVNNYQRMSLDQLKAFIQKQGHLPGVPTQDMLDREGMDLKAFSLTLLEKIEELSLYLIEQQYHIDTLMQALSKNASDSLQNKMQAPTKNSPKK